MSLKTIYGLTISTLTPVHIGSGEQLELDWDYAVHEKRTWVINHEEFGRRKLLDANGRIRPELLGIPPSQLLEEQDFQSDSPLFRYVLPGTPEGGLIGTALQSHIKDVYDNPFLPGSSLKGALRTIIFRHAFMQSDTDLDPAQLHWNPKRAAKGVERELLGANPNHDLLRALHVSDTEAVPTAQNLMVVNAQVFGSRSMDTPIALEAIRADTVFDATLTIDDYLFNSTEAQRRLQFGSKRDWLVSLPIWANEQAAQRLRQELIAFRRLSPQSPALGFYDELSDMLPKFGPNNQFILQVGWGGGWTSKTLSYLIPYEDREALVNKYDLARGHHRSGEPFPRTRRATTGNTGPTAEPVDPFGWLLIKMKERTQ